MLAGWLVDWWACWRVGWLAGWLVDWLPCWRVGWLAGWLVHWLPCWRVGWLAGSIGTSCFHVYLGAQAIGTSGLNAHFVRENTQKACNGSALEAQNSRSERLLGFQGGYRRHAKNASRFDGLQVFGVDAYFIRVLTRKLGVFFCVFLRIELQLF